VMEICRLGLFRRYGLMFVCHIVMESFVVMKLCLDASSE
jgi:hypothetical protein